MKRSYMQQSIMDIIIKGTTYVFILIRCQTTASISVTYNIQSFCGINLHSHIGNSQKHHDYGIFSE